MKIHFEFNFWPWLCRFAYRQIGHAQPKAVGIPGQRDPESPCEFFAPRKPIGSDFTDCESDGHYLCKKCAHLNKDTAIHD